MFSTVLIPHAQYMHPDQAQSNRQLELLHSKDSKKDEGTQFSSSLYKHVETTSNLVQVNNFLLIDVT